MSDVAIEVRSLGKRYRLGQTHDGLLRHQVDRALGRVLRRRPSLPASGGHIWALKDVSFQVRRGEVLGVIGRNGAGKSTLLKVLSRITKPTEGRARLRGRLASLLEVGTGFHPELTGRENIYLNGAILGMTRAEVARKFDEIVEFAEIDRFIDTPVKRYSSGMYVRLAFAVAAHLEPEILLVDEVLAVGDIAFQKKCLGKMSHVADQGRTVLFVSHNMAAIQNLCPRSILLVDGRLHQDGPTPQTVETYLNRMQLFSHLELGERRDRTGDGEVRFERIELLDDAYNPVECGVSGKTLVVRLHYNADGRRPFRNCRASVSVDARGKVYFVVSTELVRADELRLQPPGHLDCVIERLPLSRGEYYLTVFLESNGTVQDWVEAAARLSVVDGDFYGTGRNYPAGWDGKAVLVDHRWELPGEASAARLRKGA